MGGGVWRDFTGGDWAVASPPPIHRPTRGASRGRHVLHPSGWGPLIGRDVLGQGRFARPRYRASSARPIGYSIVSIRARPWMDYVRSAANIADLPYRLF
eukprot:scaffold1748_cov123-Isochrysis_galbana.AAC.1